MLQQVRLNLTELRSWILQGKPQPYSVEHFRHDVSHQRVQSMSKKVSTCGQLQSSAIADTRMPLSFNQAVLLSKICMAVVGNATLDCDDYVLRLLNSNAVRVVTVSRYTHRGGLSRIELLTESCVDFYTDSISNSSTVTMETMSGRELYATVSRSEQMKPWMPSDDQCFGDA